MSSTVPETNLDSLLPSANAATFVFSSESVSEGHPDKVCDFIADSILDAYLREDLHARVACEVLCKSDTVVLGGEISSTAQMDHEAVVRDAISRIGYTDKSSDFNAENVRVLQLISTQSPDIALGVDTATNAQKEQGQGIRGSCSGSPARRLRN